MNTGERVTEDLERTVTVFASRLEHFYTLLPVLHGLGSRGWHTRVVTRAGIQERVVALLTGGSGSVEVTSFEEFFRERGQVPGWSLRVLGRLMEMALVHPLFTPMYGRVRERDGWLARLLRWSWPWKPSDPNRLFGRVLQSFSRDLLPDGALLVLTPLEYPALVSGAEARTVTIVESWDHPVKRPFFHRPAAVFTWNEDLARDIEEVQGISDAEIIFPLKFRYIEEFGSARDPGTILEEITDPELREDLVRCRGGQPFLLYPSTTCCRNRRAFGDELRFVHALADAVSSMEYQLYVKPKPGGLPGEFDQLADHPDVMIGVYGTGAHADQLLDEDYQRYRIALVLSAHCILNVGTTFGLEAALLGAPIIQLTLEGTTRYPKLSDIGENSHLRKYLVDGKDVLLLTDDWADNQRTLRGFLDSRKPADYSDHLRDWIASDLDVSESVDRICRSLTAVHDSSRASAGHSVIPKPGGPPPADHSRAVVERGVDS